MSKLVQYLANVIHMTRKAFKNSIVSYYLVSYLLWHGFDCTVNGFNGLFEAFGDPTGEDETCLILNIMPHSLLRNPGTARIHIQSAT